MIRGLAIAVLLASSAMVVRAEDAPAPKPRAAPAAPAPAAKAAPPPTPEQAADAVFAAVKAKDDAALEARASKDDPDPWLVADELIRRGEFDAADAFARAAPRVDVEKLPAYVASRRGKPDDVAARKSLAAASAAHAAGNPNVAFELLGSVDASGPATVVEIRRTLVIGSTLAAVGRARDGVDALISAADAAERAGWLVCAAQALREAGNTAFRQSDMRTALSSYERRLAICTARGDRVAAAGTIGNIGMVYSATGDHARALEFQTRALKEFEQLGDRVGAAGTVVNIGIVYSSIRNYPAALEHLGRGLALAESSGERRWAANALTHIGYVHDQVGDPAASLAAYIRLLAMSESLADRAGAAKALGGIGNAHGRLGDYAKALAALQRAVTTKEALGDGAGAAVTIGNIGVIQFALGEYATALLSFERALAKKESLGDKAGSAMTLSNIGSVYGSIGDFAKALPTFERALAAQKALGDDRGAAITLRNIGALHFRLGDHERTLSVLQSALALQEERGDRVEAAETASAIGFSQTSLGDPAKALVSLERALATQEAMGDRAGAAATLGNIGIAYHRLGDTPSAIKFLDRAVRSAEKLGAAGLLASALQRLAWERLRAGDTGRAIESAHKAVSLLKTLVGGLGEEQGATARGQYTALFSTGLAAAAKAGDVAEGVFFLESGRAGTMLESLDARDALRHAAIPEDLRLAEATARAGEARALAAYTKALGGGDLAAIRARDEELKAARVKVQEVVERIQREAKREAHLWYPVATPVEDIQRFLALGEALVLYGLADKDDDAYALVLTKDETRIVALGKSSEIVAACEALGPTDRDADPAAALARLRDLVVKPLGFGKETKRLLVSPDGPLSYVPFAALAPDLVVAYEASGTTYGVLREEKDKRGEQVLALGDPDYTAKFDPTALDVYAPLAAARAGAMRGGRLAPLPGTREEAMAVADVKLFGKDASEPGLRAALAKKKDRWHSVHFACHGLVNPDRPTLSSLALTPEGEDDGFLTALEVLKMEIPSDLVVLSACETGKGKIVGGEGIVGLTRAFMYAGSPRVICSLWKVDDEATRALMVKFYELWNPSGVNDGKPGLPTAEALKQAQEFVKSQEKWKHPYYWAAWVLWGLPE